MSKKRNRCAIRWCTHLAWNSSPRGWCLQCEHADHRVSAIHGRYVLDLSRSRSTWECRACGAMASVLRDGEYSALEHATMPGHCRPGLQRKAAA